MLVRGAAVAAVVAACYPHLGQAVAMAQLTSRCHAEGRCSAQGKLHTVRKEFDWGA